jgi:hypothetical protein
LSFYTLPDLYKQGIKKTIVINNSFIASYHSQSGNETKRKWNKIMVV